MPATGKHLLQGQKIGIETPVLKHRQHPAPLRRNRQQMLGFGQRHGTGFVHHHMFARLQRSQRQLVVAVVGGGDHHQVNRRIVKRLLRCRRHPDLWPVAQHIVRAT